MAKCCVILSAGESIHTQYLTVQGAIRRELDAFGYDVDFLYINDNDALFDQATPVSPVDGVAYDFAVFPKHSAGIPDAPGGKLLNWRRNGLAPIPVFVCGWNQAGTTQRAGVNNRHSSSPSAEIATWLQSGTGQAITFPWNAQRYENEAATAIVTVAAATNPGADTIAWKWAGTSANVYICASSTTNSLYNLLPVLIQEAVAAGDIPAPTRRNKIIVNLDDFPAESGNDQTTLAVLTRVHAKCVEVGAIATMGVHGDFFTAADADIVAFVQANHQSRGGNLYIIDHLVSNDTAPTEYFDWDMTDGDGLLDTTVALRQAEADSRHQATIAHFAEYVDIDNATGGYRFFNQNAIGNEGLVLLKSYGMKIVRCAGNTSFGAEGQYIIDLPIVAQANFYQHGIALSYGNVMSGAVGNILDSAAYASGALSGWINLIVTPANTEYFSMGAHNFDLVDGTGLTAIADEGIVNWERGMDFVSRCNACFEFIDPKAENI